MWGESKRHWEVSDLALFMAVTYPNQRNCKTVDRHLPSAPCIDWARLDYVQSTDKRRKTKKQTSSARLQKELREHQDIVCKDRPISRISSHRSCRKGSSISSSALRIFVHFVQHPTSDPSNIEKRKCQSFKPSKPLCYARARAGLIGMCLDGALFLKISKR